MKQKPAVKSVILSVLPVSLFVAATTMFVMQRYYSRVCFQILEAFCERLVRKHPDIGQTILELLKAKEFYPPDMAAVRRWQGNETILEAYGYGPGDLGMGERTIVWIAVAGFLAGGILLLFFFRYWHKHWSGRIVALTEYLEKINTGGGRGLILDNREDEFSRLQDEIYKTVTTLYQTRDAALTARNNFAENLANIAHQLKTPVTSVYLNVQLAKEHPGILCGGAIEKQINRLVYLEEALLLLSRIDAGTLVTDPKPADVFTILSLAADNLYELSMEQGVCIDVAEMGGTEIQADPDWTMEAVMNLMKNCMEAAQPGTTVHCSYEKNPLYVQIRISDEGEGFAKEDLPRLFERFYRGRKAKDSGIGIGLSISKALIEMQNGTIRAFNLPEGGACFEIRFYSH